MVLYLNNRGKYEYFSVSSEKILEIFYFDLYYRWLAYDPLEIDNCQFSIPVDSEFRSDEYLPFEPNQFESTYFYVLVLGRL